MNNIAAIILAAGKASRFRAADPDAATKVVALYNGEPMVRYPARAAVEAKAAAVIVVTGCEPQIVRAALDGFDVSFVQNDHYESGIASSLKTGVAALPGDTRAAFIMLGDMPLVGPDLLLLLATALEANPQADAIVPVYQGQRGNPVLLGRSLFEQGKNLQGDEGAKRLLRDPALQIIEVEGGAAAALDIDTPDALKASQGQ